MTAAKTPPEQVTLYLDDYGYVWTEDEGGSQGVDPAHIYILASVVEKRERALRSALHAVTELHVQPCECAGCAALAAADEGEAKP